MTSASLKTTAMLIGAIALLAPRPAMADERQACVVASEKAQQLKNASKLVEAREQLLHCSRAECPKLIQQDCTQWMNDVLTALPSVVPAAKDKKGRDIVDAKVTVDGKVVTEVLDGKAIVLDPGVHAFHFETKGAPSIDEQVVVKPGEKNRIVTATFATGASGDEAGKPGRPSNDERPEEASSPPYAAYVFGGLGIVALGVGGFLGLSGNSDARDLRDGCAPKCSQSEVDAVQDKYTLAGVTAGVGGALLVTGIVLFFVHGKGGSRTGTSAPLSTGSFGSLPMSASIRF